MDMIEMMCLNGWMDWKNIELIDGCIFFKPRKLQLDAETERNFEGSDFYIKQQCIHYSQQMKSI
jgi:hypothetical protein